MPKEGLEREELAGGEFETSLHRCLLPNQWIRPAGGNLAAVFVLQVFREVVRQLVASRCRRNYEEDVVLPPKMFVSAGCREVANQMRLRILEPFSSARPQIACYNDLMPYEVAIPDDIHKALVERASALGENVDTLVQKAVVMFVRSGAADCLPMVRRRPDPPIAATEFPLPDDLPYRNPQPLEIELESKLRPDPPVDAE